MADRLNCGNYSVFIDNNHALNDVVKDINPSSVFILTDDNTSKFCLYKLYETADFTFTVITIPSGESFKNIETCGFVWKSLLDNGADRKSLLINLGGGVVGDLGGFCAACYMRGIPYIQIPTTLLSQVDASIGAKTGVDLANVKNIVGAFHEPSAVIVHTFFLETLPYKELLSGFAEMLKHGLIADKATWNKLASISELNEVDFSSEVLHSIKIKEEIVRRDPKEQGIRKILNFGHTIGHGLETLNLNTVSHLLHGEAIAIGIVCESYISAQKGGLSAEEYLQIKSVIGRLFGNRYKSMKSAESLRDIMKHDKKNRGSEIMFSLLGGLGEGIYDQSVPFELIEAALEDYKS